MEEEEEEEEGVEEAGVSDDWVAAAGGKAGVLLGLFCLLALLLLVAGCLRKAARAGPNSKSGSSVSCLRSSMISYTAMGRPSSLALWAMLAKASCSSGLPHNQDRMIVAILAGSVSKVPTPFWIT